MSTETVKALNERLGITDRDSLFNTSELKSVEEMLEDSRKEFEAFSQSIADAKSNVEDAEHKTKTAIDLSKNNTLSSDIARTSLEMFASSLDSMSGLISRGQEILGKLYDAIVSVDTIDSDIIEATAKIIEGIRISISDIIAFNTQKMTMEHQYRMAIDTENQKQKHRLELEEFKHKLRMEEKQRAWDYADEKEKMKATPVTSTVQGEVAQWSPRDAMNRLRESK